MDSNETRSSAARRSMRRKNRRRTPWSGFELVMFGVSLLLAISLTGSGVAPLIHAVKAARHNAEEARNNHQEYVTFWRDVVNHLSPEEGQQKSEDGFEADLDQFATDSGYAGQLYALRGEYDTAVRSILTYYEGTVCTVEGKETTVGEAFPDKAIPERLVRLAVENHEAMDFAADYPTKHQGGEVAAMKNVSTSKVPLYIQWDECWGYESYGDGMIAYTGCAPTCLAMAAAALTSNSSITPYEVANYADAAGYYTVGSGSAWTLISEGSSEFGLSARELTVDEEKMARELADGRLIICVVGPGDFTQTGHFILLTGYDNGMFTVNDPNSLIRSAEKWSFEQIKGQIKNLWALNG